MATRRVHFLTALRPFIFFIVATLSVTECASDMPKTFFYFGYGSNLLAKRIHIQNPSATRYACGKLQGYELDFYGSSSAWGGAPATIVPHPEAHVWGAVWELLEEDKESLDNQEGVKSGLYDPMEVVIESPTKGNITCRSYKLHKQPGSLQPEQPRPANRIPSRIYLEVILQGAVESGLPEDYFNNLKKIQHNGSPGGPNVPLHIPYEYTKDLNQTRNVD